MSAEIVSLSGVVSSDAKAAWLDQVAQAWDAYTSKFKAEPASTVMVMHGPGEKGFAIKSLWALDRSFDCNMQLLMAAEHLRRAADTGNG